MATDNTPPRLRLIATIAVIAVITLVGLNFVFESYYAYMVDEARREKLAPTRDKEAASAAEAAALAGGKMPIGQAMAGLAGRRGDLVEPKPSEDMGAMTGWSKLPKQLPLPAPAGVMHAPETMMATDGGALPAADGGAAMGADGGTLAADAGAPKGGAAKDAGARAPH